MLVKLWNWIVFIWNKDPLNPSKMLEFFDEFDVEIFYTPWTISGIIKERDPRVAIVGDFVPFFGDEC